MMVCQDCEDGSCDCGFPGGCEGCQFTGVCMSCRGAPKPSNFTRTDLGLGPAPGFPHVPLTIKGMTARARGMAKRCRAQRRRIAKELPPEIVMPHLLELRKQNPTSGSCPLCNRYHTSGTARQHTNSSSAAYQRGVARFRNSEWCPQCFRPFNENLGRPYAKIGPPPWD